MSSRPRGNWCRTPDERDLDHLNRKIKTTLRMLADPTFDGMDELQSTLANLKTKRDALKARLMPQNEPAKPEPKEDELRAWALKQFAGLHELTTRTEICLQDRQLVAASSVIPMFDAPQLPNLFPSRSPIDRISNLQGTLSHRTRLI